MSAPLQLTFTRWFNRLRMVNGHDGELEPRWSKVLANNGHLTRYAYGTDTPADNPASNLQRCIVCAPHTGVFVIDVDYPEQYAATRTAQLSGRDQAMDTRADRFHVLVDARGLPADQWRRLGDIPGANIKSNGWVPVPGSIHFSGEPYQPVVRPDGTVTVVACTPALVDAIEADHAGYRSSNGHGGADGHGGGHDGELAASVLIMVLRGLDKAQCYAEWCKIAVPRDPAWPFSPDDFERHYRGAVAKAAEIQGEGNAAVTPDAMAWAQDTVSRVSCAEAEKVYAKWLHDTDPVPTRIVLAAYAANMALAGDPVWVMLVGGSGIGKTERIAPVSAMPHVVMASTLTGEAALLSATPKRERAKNATGGVLRQIGDHGILVVKDFTSVLSMSRDRRAQVIAALREVYDGRWDRHYGTDGGQVLTWQGHCGFIAGCTTAIDSAHAVLDAMGTRFLFVRLPDADTGQIGRSALAHAGKEAQMRAELTKVTTGLLGNLGQPHEIHDGVASWLVPLAALASRGRSPVERDYQGEISLVGDPEAPTRLIKQLGQLWRACGMLGLDEARSWEAVRRAGLDSIPKLRRAVIECLGRSAGEEVPTREVARQAGHPSRTTLRALEDLAAHGIVSRHAETGYTGRRSYAWELSEQALTWWNALKPVSLPEMANSNEDPSS